MLTILPNTLTHTREEILAIFTREKIAATPLSWHDTALSLDTDKDTLTHLPEFMEGYFYLQNPSSLLPVLALDPQPGEKVLDLAAAPGGKTIHMAIRMDNTGEIIANDLSPGRVARMRRLLTTYGVTSVTATAIPGQRLWTKYPGYFDRVLLDAPCSMHGTDTPSSDSPAKMARLQRWLLRSAISACRPGGVIVYSTCTTAVEENEEVIDWILRKDQGKVLVEPIVIRAGARPSPATLMRSIAGTAPSCEQVNIHTELLAGRPSSPHVPSLLPALTTTVTGIPLHPSVTNCIRVAKTDEFEGFFVAKMRRVDN
ncbi:MAG: RsmB/NOP family class I SAM-dependent RNA methyltransferase [bacterium]